MDLCCLQEIKLKLLNQKDASIAQHGKYSFHFLDNPDSWHGLGFAVKKTLGTNVTTKKITDRIAVLTLDIGNDRILNHRKSRITVINVHAPTANNGRDRDVFFEDLNKVVGKFKSESLFCISGDFNSKVGERGERIKVSRATRQAAET